MTDSLLIAIQQTLSWWESLGFQDARKGKPANPLPGIDPRWVTAYQKGFQEGLLLEVTTDPPF